MTSATVCTVFNVQERCPVNKGLVVCRLTYVKMSEIKLDSIRLKSEAFLKYLGSVKNTLRQEDPAPCMYFGNLVELLSDGI